MQLPRNIKRFLCQEIIQKQIVGLFLTTIVHYKIRGNALFINGLFTRPTIFFCKGTYRRDPCYNKVLQVTIITVIKNVPSEI